MNDVGLTRAALASFIGNFALFGDTAYLGGASGAALVAMLACRETSRLRLVDD